MGRENYSRHKRSNRKIVIIRSSWTPNHPKKIKKLCFHTWKSQSHAPVSENCLLKGWKNCSKSYVFFLNSCFTTGLEPFVGQFHFLPSHVDLLLHLPCSRSQHAVSAVRWAPLPLPHVCHQIFVDLAFLSSTSARWNLILNLLPCAIDSTCVRPQDWFHKAS